MIRCKACFAINPDNVAVCTACKAPLDKAQPLASAGMPGRMPTEVEARPGKLQRRETVDESVGVFSSKTASSVGAGQMQSKGGTLPSTPPPGRRVTVYDPGDSSGPGAQDAAAPAKRPPSSARKIVGVLVTYSWSDQGQIFPVLEGRNRIGSDPNECDIVIPQDDTLSAINSHIVYRKSFTIGDDVSMGGTDVDGEPVETAFVPLRNYARIRTGSTHWTFIAIQPPVADLPETK